MRTLAVLGSVAALGLAVAGLGTSAPSQPGDSASARRRTSTSSPTTGLTLATDNPAFPPWWGGKPNPWLRDFRPYSARYESAVAYEVMGGLGFTR